jgi:hypothetical protein
MMKATTWKAVLAAFNPSPVFEVIAEFAELRAKQRSGELLQQSMTRPPPRRPFTKH